MKAPLLDAADFDRVFAHIETMKRPAHYRLLLVLCRDLGLRPIELAKLESSWFRGGELRIPHGQSKRKRPRSIMVSPTIMEALEDHMQGRVGRVFLNQQGETFKPNTIGDSLRRLFREAGIQASCYSGRRTLATRLVDANVNILTIQSILGHSNPMTTLAYCEVTPEMQRKALFG
jgi:integrase